MSSPFPATESTPGRGLIELIHVPPKASALRTLSYQYPLKLVAPAPLTSRDEKHVQTVYLLTYGGGLVAGDGVDLKINLHNGTRLILLTQGSTKIFKSPSLDTVTTQLTTVDVYPNSSLCYLPDPVQPFKRSCFEQRQVYRIHTPQDSNQQSGSLCVLDWVSQGRIARGEDWNMLRYVSRNDVFLCDDSEGSRHHAKRLLLRDNLVLHPTWSDGSQSTEPSYAEQMHGIGVFGTLILHGPLFASLAAFFHDEFKLIPRIGSRKWDSPTDEEPPTDVELRRAARQRIESQDGLLWTVASLRGCTVVKFGAREVEGGKKWVRAMMEAEGSVIQHFGERALLCMR